jgi:hypothetical protein
VNQTTEEKRGIKKRRTQYTKEGKKESLSKEKTSKEERKTNVVVINIQTCAEDHIKSQHTINRPGVYVKY